MYRGINEVKLLRPDIADLLQDYTSIQLDIDDKRVKSAALIAQNIDIERVIGKGVLSRFVCVDESELSDEDRCIYEYLIPAWCYFTYSRLLLMFHGSFSDSGFEIDSEGTDRNIAKSVSKEHKSVAEHYMEKVIECLPSTDCEKVQQKNKLTPRVRVFGGKENRASN